MNIKEDPNRYLLEYCKEHLAYDPETGAVTWKKRVSNYSRVKIGAVAGSIGTKGYRRITFTDCEMAVHRLAFLMYHGYMPEFIDHIDRDPMNNKINNLRACTATENKRNVGPQKRNTSGYKGVYWNKRDTIWQASIGIDGVLKHIGYFSCKHTAARHYNLAARMYHGAFAYTNILHP